MVCCLDEKFSDAEQFFELSTTADPANIIAWTMRGGCLVYIRISVTCLLVCYSLLVSLCATLY